MREHRKLICSRDLLRVERDALLGGKVNLQADIEGMEKNKRSLASKLGEQYSGRATTIAAAESAVDAEVRDEFACFKEV